MKLAEIQKCRVCGSSDLTPVLDLGNQALTGVFPASTEQEIATGPLELVKCLEDNKGESCGLVQLRQTYAPSEIYGENYGYRSGLNPTMVEHLRARVDSVLDRVDICSGDLVIDIGSNDGTLLGFYPAEGITLVGIDPTAQKFKDYYPEHVHVIPEFFSSALVGERLGARKAKAVTSVAMFYDLDDPVTFMREVHEVLADDGIWVFEQSYMPTMLDANAYDTVCHEHLEYYRLKQIKWMTDAVGFKIIDVEFNEVNGGSFSVVVSKADSPYWDSAAKVNSILKDEEARGFGTLSPYKEFRQRVHCHREELRELLRGIRKRGESIAGYGASTKGNVILQFCDFTSEDIPYIAEVNSDKFGCFTPGTHIPIIPEADARSRHPDYLMVFPWHFREFFLEKERPYLESGGKLVFPLPTIEVVSN